MKLYAVVNYYSARFALVFPMFYYISEDKNKCENILEEKQKNQVWGSSYSIIEIQTDTELNYLIGQEIW
jgi:hypothetical protein